MGNIYEIKKNIEELENMYPRDVSVKLEIQEKQKKLNEILNKNSNQKNKYIEDRIEKNRPFQNQIWTYIITNLYGKWAESWKAFLLETDNGEKYKLRICLDDLEINKTKMAIKNHKNSMPNYYGKEEHNKVSCFLFKRLDDAQILNEFDKNVYTDRDWLKEPHEMYKKPAKELARINLWSGIHTNSNMFRKELEIRMGKIEKEFSESEFILIKNFFNEQLKNEKLKYGDEHQDANFGNWMIEKSNPHKAYAIDEWSINQNFLIWVWFASFMMNNLEEKEVRKFLKWYYKIHPNMEFDKSYFELIYAVRALKSTHNWVKNNNLDKIKRNKQKLLKLINCFYNKNGQTYREKIPTLYYFIKVNENLKKKI